VSRERQILDAAAALFYDRGFHGVGVDEIGERVGVSGPALYRHFQSKDEILATLFNEAMDELISATAAVYDDPRRDLERLIRHHVEFSIQHRQLVNVYQREDRSLVEPWRRHFDRRMRQYASRWEAALSRCFPQASKQHVAAATQAAIGLIHSVAYWPTKVIKANEDLPDFLCRLVIEGLATLGTPAESRPAVREVFRSAT
jgi:AcrR family transcriptional regulator